MSAQARAHTPCELSEARHGSDGRAASADCLDGAAEPATLAHHRAPHRPHAARGFGAGGLKAVSV